MKNKFKSKFKEEDLEAFLNDDFSSGYMGDEIDGTSRSPVESFGSNAKDLIKAGVPQTFKSVGSHILSSMPDTSELISEIESAKGIIDTPLQELREEIRKLSISTRRATAYALPKSKAFLPKSIYNTLEKFSKNIDSTPSHKQLSTEEEHQSEVNDLVNNIFSKQAQLNIEELKHRNTSDIIEKAKESLRFKSNASLLSSINDQLIFSNTLATNTHQNWMKKMLELKYMHLYTSKESLSVLKIMSNSFNDKIDAVIKNTSLPDFIKARSSEFTKYTAKGLVTKKTLGSIGGVVTKLSENLKSGLTDNIGSLTQMLEMYSDMASSEADMEEDFAAMGMTDSKGSKIGKFLGKGIGTIGGRLGLSKIRPVTEAIDRTSRDIQGKIKTGQRDIAESFKESRNPILRFIGNSISLESPHVDVGNQLITDGAKATQFDNVTRQSIVEIIPMWLSKISKHTKDISLGTSTEQEWYDPISRKIVAISDAKSTVMNAMLGAPEERGAQMLTSLGAIKGLSETNIDVGLSTYEELEKDLLKVINNAVVLGVVISPKVIRRYRNATSKEELTGTRISGLMRGVSDPIGVIKLLNALLFHPNGAKNDTNISFINEGILNEQAKDTLREKLPQYLETFGAYSIFADDIDNTMFSREKLDEERMRMAPEVFEKGGIVDLSADLTKTQKRTDIETRANFKKSKLVSSLPDDFRKKAGNVSKKNLFLISQLSQYFSDEEIEEILDENDLNDLENLISKKNKLRKDISSKKVRKNNTINKANKAGKGFEYKKDTNDYTSIDSELIVDVLRSNFGDLYHLLDNRLPSVKEDKKDTKSPDGKILSELESFHTSFNKYTEETDINFEMLIDAILTLDSGGGGKPDSNKSGKSSFNKFDKPSFNRFNKFDKPSFKDLRVGDIMDKIKNKSKAGFDYAREGVGKLGGFYKNMFDGTMDLGGKAIPNIKDFLSKGKDNIGDFLSKAGPELKDLGNKGLDTLGSFYSGTFDLLGKTVDKIPSVKFKKKFFDVYLKGNVIVGKPLLSAKDQKTIAIKSDTNKPLSKTKDITVPILHIETGDVLISEEDIKTGLVDINGKPIHSEGIDIDLSGIMDGGRDILNKGLDFLSGGTDLYKSALDKAGKGISSLGGTIKGKFGYSAAKDTIVEKLDNIIDVLRTNFGDLYHLLDTRLPEKKRFDDDGDGIVSGSYEDYIKNKEESDDPNIVNNIIQNQKSNIKNKIPNANIIKQGLLNKAGSIGGRVLNTAASAKVALGAKGAVLGGKALAGAVAAKGALVAGASALAPFALPALAVAGAITGGVLLTKHIIKKRKEKKERKARETAEEEFKQEQIESWVDQLRSENASEKTIKKFEALYNAGKIDKAENLARDFFERKNNGELKEDEIESEIIDRKESELKEDEGEDTEGEDTEGEDTEGEDTEGEDTEGEDTEGEISDDSSKSFFDKLKGGAKKALSYTPAGLLKRGINKFKDTDTYDKLKGGAKKALSYTPAGLLKRGINKFKDTDTYDKLKGGAKTIASGGLESIIANLEAKSKLNKKSTDIDKKSSIVKDSKPEDKKGLGYIIADLEAKYKQDKNSNINLVDKDIIERDKTSAKIKSTLDSLQSNTLEKSEQTTLINKQIELLEKISGNLMVLDGHMVNVADNTTKLNDIDNSLNRGFEGVQLTQLESTNMLASRPVVVNSNEDIPNVIDLSKKRRVV
jgi:hypothetical protein